MPSDEYASAAAGGALKLKGGKGGKVEKHKHKKHKHKKRDKEKEEKLAKAVEEKEKGEEEEEDRGSEKEGKKEKEEEDPYANMTPAERRFAEAQDKKIRDLLHATPEEARASRPELFKSHRERLADLNAYLSRMSEHHDMPKIGPG